MSAPRGLLPLSDLPLAGGPRMRWRTGCVDASLRALLTGCPRSHRPGDVFDRAADKGWSASRSAARASPPAPRASPATGGAVSPVVTRTAPTPAPRATAASRERSQRAPGCASRVRRTRHAPGVLRTGPAGHPRRPTEALPARQHPHAPTGPTRHASFSHDSLLVSGFNSCQPGKSLSLKSKWGRGFRVRSAERVDSLDSDEWEHTAAGAGCALAGQI